jgi:uncharacterized protein (DUF433 family)
MDWRDRIIGEPGGPETPSIKGSAVEVEAVLRLLRDGWTVDRVRARFPDLLDEDVHACLDYALELLERDKLRSEMRRRIAHVKADPESLIPHDAVMRDLFPGLADDDE